MLHTSFISGGILKRPYGRLQAGCTTWWCFVHLSPLIIVPKTSVLVFCTSSPTDYHSQKLCLKVSIVWGRPPYTRLFPHTGAYHHTHDCFTTLGHTTIHTTVSPHWCRPPHTRLFPHTGAYHHTHDSFPTLVHTTTHTTFPTLVHTTIHTTVVLLPTPAAAVQFQRFQ